MRIAFIGDIVGRPGRLMIKEHLSSLKQEFKIQTVIANVENASGGFGIIKKNADELLSYGIDVMSGGNHIFDKKEIFDFIDDYPIVRPINYGDNIGGKSLIKLTINNEDLIIINAMGLAFMPYTDNPFILLQDKIKELQTHKRQNIFIDFHAEVTSEKRALFKMLQGKISGLIGTHTHIGTDDLEISQGSAYCTDIGLTGCVDGVIGMDSKKPIERFLNYLPIKYDISNSCKRVIQMIIMDLENGICKNAFKVKIIDGQEPITMKAINFG